MDGTQLAAIFFGLPQQQQQHFLSLVRQRQHQSSPTAHPTNSVTDNARGSSLVTSTTPSTLELVLAFVEILRALYLDAQCPEWLSCARAFDEQIANTCALLMDEPCDHVTFYAVPTREVGCLDCDKVYTVRTFEGHAEGQHRTWIPLLRDGSWDGTPGWCLTGNYGLVFAAEIDPDADAEDAAGLPALRLRTTTVVYARTVDCDLIFCDMCQCPFVTWYYFDAHRRTRCNQKRDRHSFRLLEEPVGSAYRLVYFAPTAQQLATPAMHRRLPAAVSTSSAVTALEAAAVASGHKARIKPLKKKAELLVDYTTLYILPWNTCLIATG